jgi:hypothetical protein
MAGGSLPVIPDDISKEIVNETIGMKPVPSADKDIYLLSDGGKRIISYNIKTKTLEKR